MQNKHEVEILKVLKQDAKWRRDTVHIYMSGTGFSRPYYLKLKKLANAHVKVKMIHNNFSLSVRVT
jgi:hypothetical protein